MQAIIQKCTGYVDKDDFIKDTPESNRKKEFKQLLKVLK
jgi:hypothetical protein